MTLESGVTLRPIPVSPNEDYMAGDDGNIYSRTKYAGFGRKDFVDWYVLKGHIKAKGYRSVSLCHENVKVTANVHRLVCMAFHGMPPTPTHQTRHLDGNPANNTPLNLAWGTQIDNWEDRKIHNKPYSNATYKFTPEERSHIRWAISNGLCSQRQAARILGVSQSSVWSIVNT